MLGRLLLLLVQLVVGWHVGLEIMSALPDLQNLQLFVLAAIFALVSWAIGILAAAILKDVAQPGPTTVLFSLAVAVIATAVSLYPDATAMIQSVVGNADRRLYPLVGAVIGYALAN